MGSDHHQPITKIPLYAGCCLAVIRILKHGILTITNQSQDSYAPPRSFIHCSIIRDNPRFVIIRKSPYAGNGSLLLLTECLYKMTKRDTEQASLWTAAPGMIRLKSDRLRNKTRKAITSITVLREYYRLYSFKRPSDGFSSTAASRSKSPHLH